jgi:hypothetical protein
MRSGKILDIRYAEPGRRVVDTYGAFEAKLSGPLRKARGRNMIAKDILRPGNSVRSGVISSSDSSTFWSWSSRGRSIIRCSPNDTGCL